MMRLFDRKIEQNPDVGDIKWGKLYRDKYTGFEGYPVAITVFQYGCRRVFLEKPIYNQRGEVTETKEVSFDEQRLIKVEDEKPVESRATTGGSSSDHYGAR